MALLLNDNFDLNSIVSVKEEKQIDEILKNDKNNIIKQRENQYYSINVADAMTQLASCGKLIQLAYAGSNGFICQAKIVKLLSEYSTLVKDSYIASTKFVNASISACQFHKLALQVLNKSPDKAIIFISKCSKLAETMAIIANGLIDKSEKLTSIAKDALESAVSDKTITNDKKNEIIKKMEQTESESKKLKKMTQDLADQVQDLKVEQEKAAKQAEQERSRQFTLNIIKTVMSVIPQINSNNNNNNNINKNNEDNKDNKDDSDNKPKTIEDKEWLLMKQKYEVQNKLIEQNAELAKTLSELANFKEGKNQLEKALKAIEITIKTLGKIQVVFSNTKIFWVGVQENCNKLIDQSDTIKLLADMPDFIEDMKKAVTESALNWFILCKVNYFAKKQIIQVDAGMDNILNDLPNENESLELVNQLSKDMQIALQEENKIIQKESKAIQDVQ